jgi:hypothetical protein
MTIVGAEWVPQLDTTATYSCQSIGMQGGETQKKGVRPKALKVFLTDGAQESDTWPQE